MCEVAQRFAGWLGLAPDIQAALEYVFARWDGRGFPDVARRGDPAADAAPARGARHLAVPLRRRAGRGARRHRAPGGRARTTRGSPSSPCANFDELIAEARRDADVGAGARERAVPAALDRGRAGRRRLRGHRRDHRSQVAVAARALDRRGRARRGRRVAHGPPGRRPSRSCAAPRSRTTSAGSASRTRSGRSPGRSASASGSACGSTRTSPSAPSPSRRRSPRSGCWPARTTSASTAPATTAARAGRRSTRPPGSSPPPTATRPCARRGRTGRLSTRRLRRRSCCARPTRDGSTRKRSTRCSPPPATACGSDLASCRPA